MISRTPVVSQDRLAQWCREQLGAVVLEELFREGYLSTVIGVRLDDGREVVVKIRSASPRLEGCLEVHRRLAESGFPCPRPLSDALGFEEYAVTVESYVPGGELLPSTGRLAAPFAAAFSRLIELAPAVSEVPSLYPSPPWTNWAHDQPGLWPWPNDHNENLNLVGGPGWIDRAGTEARARLKDLTAPSVVAHGDWYTGNLRWQETELQAVHDWDSVMADTEAAVVGFAAAVYPTLHAGDEASIAESEQFLDAYLEARRRPFDRDELECCWAAGVWLRAFDSKKQHAKRQPVLSLTEQEAHERLQRAGTR